MAHRIDLQSITHTDTDGEIVGIYVIEADTLEEASQVFREKNKLSDIKRIETYEAKQPIPHHVGLTILPCIVIYFRS